MARGYELLENYESNYCVCDKCLEKLTTYTLKWNGKKFKCILNDNRKVVLTSPTSQPIIFHYRDIRCIEMRRWMKIVLVMKDREIVLSGFRRKSAFYKLKSYFSRQLLF